MQLESSNLRGLRPGILVAAVTGALAMAQAQAVGLGGIDVQSKLNEPFVAEIPLNVDYRGQMDEMRVHLASPEEFERVGLQRPPQMSANLTFKITRNARGEAVVRVTTPQKMTDPYVSFLLDVEWSNGKMVREYTAMLAPPHVTEVPHVAIAAPTVASTPMPAPVVSPPVASAVPPASPPTPPPATTVPPPVATAPAPAPEVAAPMPAPPAAEAPAPEPIAAAAPPEPAAPEPVAAPPPPEPLPPPPAASAPPPPPPPPPPPASTASSAAAITVGRGQTLSAIADQVDATGASRNRVMIALQRANPDAFINGNINLLREGAVLRVPDADALRAITPEEANSLVHEQVESWRRGHGAPPQLQPVEGAAHAAAVAAGAPTGAAGRAADSHAQAATSGRAGGPRGARLEILPPAGQAGGRGQSGSAEGGAGSELRAQLAQSKEDLAARQAEIRDLKAHVADLEKIKTDSQKMLALKDSQMAALQARLAELEKKDAAAAAPAAPGASPASPASPPAMASAASAAVATSASPAVVASPAAAPAAPKPSTQRAPAVPPPPATPWYMRSYVLIGGGLLLFAGLLGAMLKRPGKGRTPPQRSIKSGPEPRRRNFDVMPRAAGMSAAGVSWPASSDAGAPASAAADVEAAKVTAPVEAAPSDWSGQAEPAAHGSTPPPWQPATVAEAEPAPEPAPEPVPEPAPEPAAPAAAAVVTPPADGQWTVPARIEAARAYIENGDIDSARTMLEAALIDGNAAQQEEAFKLLDMIDSW